MGRRVYNASAHAENEHGYWFPGYSLDGDSEPEDALAPFIQQAIDQVSAAAYECRLYSI